MDQLDRLIEHRDELRAALTAMLQHYASKALECEDWCLSGNSQTDAILRQARAALAKRAYEVVSCT